MKKIFCFGDGFATGHIWPEWPQILQTLVPQYQVINTAGIGAGTEFLVSGFVDLIDQMHDSIVIFQWSAAERFDKMIQDNSWQNIIANDPTYYFNVNIDSHNRKWWLSSASKVQEIRNYHNIYAQQHQHNRRQQVYHALVSQTASNLDCQIVHTSTESADTFSQHNRFRSTRQTQVQPSPIVHFYWLIEQIIPQIAITVDQDLQKKLELLINQTQWIPYDPEREAIWLEIDAKLKSN
ncbi:hypothetical protein [Haliscomenobacter sp.]|jgi:hypothetical protein|uniref:hypothetical protein n=1 Tax=Haliscomenobacter sp. TaxID=2717303 RepID=UPI003364D8A3